MNSNALTAKIPSHILSESLSGETILLDMSSGMYFGLTPVASRFWKLLAEGSTREAIQTTLLSEFEVEPDVLSSDLDNLLVDLEAKKLIQRQTN
jgi:hypothetical protein